jgi:2-dehydro-3-deoxygluconokinase
VELVTRIVVIGEAMLELSRRSEGWQMGYGGDTLNTAIHLARAGHDVAYLTALGGDALSGNLRAEWGAEGLDCSMILTHPSRQPGLYAISTDTSGERSFTYWRDASAAREMFALPDMAEALKQAERADLLAFSLITLAILPPEGRSALLALARRVRERGGKVAFDGNYRPRLWPSAAEARAARDAAIACADIGLPTLEDEMLLASSTDPLGEELVATHWQGLGCSEVIVKLGARGCRLPNGTIVPPPEKLAPVDTSGAGDAFNAGYLSARLNGASADDAAQAGHALAGWTIMRPGAIPARDS